jgi:replicative DNA helicase
MTTAADDFERVPPQDLDAEQSVLGGMLLSKTAIDEVTELLVPAAFYKPAHETIYTAILDLYAKGEPADPITVSAHLTKQGSLDKVGGAAYIHHLVQQVPTAANAAYYAEIVHEHAALRGIVGAGTQIVQLGYGGRGDLEAVKDQANALLTAALTERETGQITALGDDYDDYLDDLENRKNSGDVTGIPTGFADLDMLTHGLHPGQVIIVAARPAMGKSTLAVDFARSAAIRHTRPSAFFSLEMSRRELQDRILSAEARIGLHHIRSGNLTDDDWTKAARVIERITAAPLYIDDTASTTVTQIKARCRRLQQRHGLDLVVIDYLQLLTSGLRRVENRQLEVSEMSRSLKLLAKELGVPVVVLSQLNRGPEHRTDKKPILADLRESGSLEQDADVVILLHREDAYDKESQRSGEVDLIIAKHRNGPTATITVANQLHYSRFADMSAEPDTAAPHLRPVPDDFGEPA